MTAGGGTVPDWTRRCRAVDLWDIPEDNPFMLRTSDDPDSPWQMVSQHFIGHWKDRDTGVRVDYFTVAFHDDSAERVLNPFDETEVGFIRPPWWPDDAEPPEWPRGFKG